MSIAVSTPDTVTRERWDRALGELAVPAPLLQSWAFGEVQAQEGWSVERLVLPGGGRATVLLQGSGPLRWAYVPRGPVPATAETVADLVAWARERRLARLRVEPEAPIAFGGELRALGFQPSTAAQPRHTLIVPLADEETMLASFKPKHRYNVRLAQRRGVVVQVERDAAELKRQSDFTAHRQGISLLTLEQYRRRLELLDGCRVYVARWQGQALAAIMVASFGGRAYYLYGGSSDRHRQLMPTYAVQWAAMRDAAEAGCRDYDLWGIPPSPDPAHPWFGLWQFKMGFGGEQVEYCGAWDLVFSPLAARIDELAVWGRRALRRLR
ncbi:MAG TPA: peptidoglycan bridge formation glycyltransferase FemA/FemB family protein [Candidatus Dormibacteraeota bacterium]|nr:peptidoglycan bridge formation glycyltransferase FemA/FemB family protein [Candidatus Dormibacteraeota bacterium]